MHIDNIVLFQKTVAERLAEICEGLPDGEVLTTGQIRPLAGLGDIGGGYFSDPRLSEYNIKVFGRLSSGPAIGGNARRVWGNKNTIAELFKRSKNPTQVNPAKEAHL